MKRSANTFLGSGESQWWIPDGRYHIAGSVTTPAGFKKNCNETIPGLSIMYVF